MDHLGIDLFSHEGNSYLIVADLVSGYCFCKFLGNKTSANQVADKVKTLFLKIEIPFHVHMKEGPQFRGPFRDLLEEFKIPFTPS